jgi:stage V sporulation protein G
MEVTEVRVFPVDEEKLRAYVTITFDHCFVIRDLKVIQGLSGLFVSMPSRRRKDGTYKDIAHPINNETRRMIEERIIAEYQKVLAEERSQRALAGE